MNWIQRNIWTCSLLQWFLITVISSTKILTYEISWIKNSFRIFFQKFFWLYFIQILTFPKNAV